VNQVYSYKKILLYGAGFFILWFGLHACVLYRAGFSWEIAMTDAGVNNGLLFILCFAMAIALHYYRPGKSNSSYLLAWTLILAALCVWLTDNFLSIIYPAEASYISMLDKIKLVRFCIAFLIIGCVVLLSWILNKIGEQKEEENRKANAEKLLREAELAGLRQQLQPHFLFNSLNSISALAGSKPEEARKMIQQLSDFLRGTLKKDENKLVSLKEELHHLQLYLDIEKVRFGHRLKTEIDAGESSLSLLLPPLLLQPLVENAIKFGLYDTVGEVVIGIKARKEDTSLEVQISNPFDPQTAHARGTGFGLASVQRRLQLLFSRSDLLQTQAKENVFTATVKIPQHV
jgi:LytS/YehU family sensor histidine kinase